LTTSLYNTYFNKQWLNSSATASPALRVTDTIAHVGCEGLKTELTALSVQSG